MKSSNNRRRNSTGSIFSMIAMLAGLGVFACMCAFAWYMLFAQQKSGQSDTDNVALTSAKLLNDGDRIGQMNNVVERCRELVFISRTNKAAADNLGVEMYQPLAQQLLDESRANSSLVEAERQNQTKLAIKNVQTYVSQYNMTQRTGSKLKLPWVQTAFPEINAVYMGSISGIECNVENLQVFPGLRDFDVQMQYIQPGSNLYRGNLDAKLPAPDNDLTFKLSSLPTDVGGTVTPVRLTNPDVFLNPTQVMTTMQETGQRPEQLPGALQIVESMDVASNGNKTSIRLSSTATADGALPPP
jgi:hypothetical protein